EDETESFEDSNESMVDANESFEDSNESMVDANESFEDNDESFEEENAHADILGGDILGADISGFKLSNGTYYLCRSDYSQLMEVGRLNPNWFRNLVRDTIDYTEIGGWRKTGRPDKPIQSFTELKNVRCTIYGSQLNEFYTIEELTKSSLVDKAVEFTSEFSDKKTKYVDTSESMESTSISLTELTKDSGPLVGESALKKIVLKVELSGDKQRRKVLKKAVSIEGVESVGFGMNDEELIVTGAVDLVTVVACLRKLVATEIISVGPANEPQKEDKRKLLSVNKNMRSAEFETLEKNMSNVPTNLNITEKYYIASYNPSAFPKPSNGNAFSATLILSETANRGKALCNALQLIKVF
ncbi:hypothetical protein Tco_1277412, partial [Tanacetum coccineum]